MANGNRVEGLDVLKARARQILRDAPQEMLKANDRNASEFMALVAQNIPTEEGDLAATLVKEPLDTGTGYSVSVGGPAAPYPMHLEGGHMSPNGKLVPAKPFWNPAKRVLKKRAAGRSGRALNKVVKAATTGGGS